MDSELLDIIIERLLSMRKPGRQVQLSEPEMRRLCSASKDMFLAQPNVPELEPPIKICGDIHGQYPDLLRIFESGGFPPTANYLFMPGADKVIKPGGSAHDWHIGWKKFTVRDF